MPFDFPGDSSHPPASPARVTGLLMTLLAAWQARRERARQRRQILALDDRMLRDIGLSRVDAIQGVARRLHRP